MCLISRVVWLHISFDSYGNPIFVHYCPLHKSPGFPLKGTQETGAVDKTGVPNKKQSIRHVSRHCNSCCSGCGFASCRQQGLKSFRGAYTPLLESRSHEGVPGRPGKSEKEGQEDQGTPKHLGPASADEPGRARGLPSFTRQARIPWATHRDPDRPQQTSQGAPVACLSLTPGQFPGPRTGIRTGLSRRARVRL